MQFGILGPVQVRVGDAEVALGGPKVRALLAILLLNANEPVSRERLIDGLWGERPPASASHTLDDYLSRLRKALGGDRIETRPPGYLLRAQPDELDVQRFEALLEEGRDALAAGDASRALKLLDDALAVWRGPALADLASEPVGRDEGPRLEERRLLAVEERIDAALATGRDGDLVGELERLVAAHPWRERPIELLMLALYRSGRQAAALEAFQAARVRMTSELGLEPGPRLSELQARILRHDPTLGRPQAPPRARSHEPPAARARAVGVMVVALVGLVAALIVLAARGGEPTSRAASGSPGLVALSLRSGAPRQSVVLPGAPAAMVMDGPSLWTADPDAGTVSRIDLQRGEEAQRITLGGDPAILARVGSSVWVAGVPGDTVTRIDRATESVTQTVRLAGARTTALTAGDGALWVADAAGDRLVRIDPATGEVQRTIAIGLHPTALAVGAGGIWVADYSADTVAEIDPRSGQTLTTANVGQGPDALTVGNDGVWVANALDSTVSRIDPASGHVLATIAVGSGPAALAAAAGSVWVASQYPGTVARIDPRRDTVVKTTPVDGAPTSVVIGGDRVWLGARAAVEHRGGTLVMVRQAPLPIDPGVSVGMTPFQTTNLAYDGLVTFNHAAGPKGLQLVPDLALSLPAPSDGGLTYTFRLRPGMRYSNGRPIVASDFRRAIERALLIRGVDSDALTNLVGAPVCVAPHVRRCDLSRGVVADDRAATVTFHLRGPDAHFLENVAEGGLSVPVPPGTPMHDAGFNPIPGTGPYTVAAADDKHILYVRNRRFREWSHAAQPAANPDRVIWHFGLTPEQQVRAVITGRADWTADLVPGALLPTLRARYASRLLSHPNADTEFLQFNTRHAPFDDVRVRRAVNLAIDRRVIVRDLGGEDAATPTCQLLAPSVPGYHPYCPYSAQPARDGTWTAPDLERARRLVAASGTRGMRITVWGWTDDAVDRASISRYTASVLRGLGYRTHVKLVSHAYLAHPPARVFSSITVIPGGWGAMQADDFFTAWIACAGANNHGFFCDRRTDAAIRRARSVDATRPRAATRRWTAIDRDVTNQAALVPLVNLRWVDFFSARFHNVQHNPFLGPIVMQGWLR